MQIITTVTEDALLIFLPLGVIKLLELLGNDPTNLDLRTHSGTNDFSAPPKISIDDLELASC